MRKFNFSPYCSTCGTALNSENWKSWCRKSRFKRCTSCFKKHLERTSERRREIAKQRVRLQKLKVIKAYGGKCTCCGESTFEFLTVDHTQGSGSVHRQTIKGRLYKWLEDSSFPKSDFQLLCWNCNTAKFYYGQCPHDALKNQHRSPFDLSLSNINYKSKRHFSTEYKLQVLQQLNNLRSYPQQGQKYGEKGLFLRQRNLCHQLVACWKRKFQPQKILVKSENFLDKRERGL